MKIFFELSNRYKTIVYALLVFSIAIFVRFLVGQDSRFEIWKIQPGLIENYQVYARFIIEDGFFSFFDSQARVANLDFMGHPPGYSFVLALIFSAAGDSDFAVQSFSVLVDALAAVVIFLIARKLLDDKIAFLTGLLAAFAPQLALNSVLLLPDTLAVFPILLAIYFLVLSLDKPPLLLMVFSGISLGLSCWLRANSLLLPLFFMLAIWFLFEKRKKLVLSTALFAAFVLTVAPMTIRNAIVYKEFIPISLGAGQILLEGIGDYDAENKYGIPATDSGICEMEAKKFNKAEYALTLFGADGIWRDRMRLETGWDFIKEHPFWFTQVWVRRAFWMLKLEKAQKVSPEVSISRVPAETGLPPVIWESKGTQLAENGSLMSPNASFSRTADNSALLLQTDDSKYDAQFSVETDLLKKNYEYLTDITLQLKKGRISVKIRGVDSGRTYFSTVEVLDWRNAAKPMQTLRLYFVPARDEKVKIVISNETPNPPTSLVEIEGIKMFELGKATYAWTRIPRFFVSLIQKLFTTNVMLPLAVIGLVILIRRRKWTALIILLIVPIYNFCIQSALHTEYRYVLVIHYFFFVLAAVAMVSAFDFLFRRARNFSGRFSSGKQN